MQTTFVQGIEFGKEKLESSHDFYVDLCLYILHTYTVLSMSAFEHSNYLMHAETFNSTSLSKFEKLQILQNHVQYPLVFCRFVSRSFE